MEDQDTIRLQLTLHYDGSGFHGWQLQPDLRTVQGDLEAALSRLADRPCTVTGSGRTDAGVHATGQVAAVDMPTQWSAEGLHRALNAMLPHDIWVETVRAVPGDFHPRYDPLSRSYEYRVGTSVEAASPFHRRWCWSLGTALDEGALAESATRLVGEHSFRAFAKSGQPERGYTCRVSEATWSAWELGVVFRITADRFLHHMVRYLVGTMVDVGRGVRPAHDVGGLLDGAMGSETSPPAPPEGLYLVAVEYPEPVDPPRPFRSAELRSPAPA